MTLLVEPQIASLCRIVEVRASPVVVRPASSSLEAEMDALAAELAKVHAGKQPSEIDGLRDSTIRLTDGGFTTAEIADPLILAAELFGDLPVTSASLSGSDPG